MKENQKLIELERLRDLALKIQDAVEKAGLNNDDLFREARKQAWEEFKEKNLKHILN